ncbi:MAG: hypothetical protein EU539_03245 [Promethearchaeota archaeon]|nr:MAG: hypothetical protein EU539_03245 [Candidatus Lokiarchaeota archaeon]
MMSRSYNKKTQYYLEEIQNPFKNSFFNIKEFQKRKFFFISELLLFLFNRRKTRETYKHVSDLIKISLFSPESYFLDKIFSIKLNSQFEDFNFRDYIIIIKKIIALLKQHSAISNRELLKNCQLERFFIKVCLEDYLSDAEVSTISKEKYTR